MKTVPLSNISTILKKVDLKAISPRQGSLLILVILTILGGMAWASITEKEQYLVQRNFRVLNLWSQETLAKINSFTKVFELAAAEISWNGNQHVHKVDKSYGSRNLSLSTNHEAPHNEKLLSQHSTHPGKGESRKLHTQKSDPIDKKVEALLEKISGFMKCSLTTSSSLSSSYQFLKNQLCATKEITDISLSTISTDNVNKQSFEAITEGTLNTPRIHVRYIKAFEDTRKRIDISATVDLQKFMNRLTKESPFEEVLVFQSPQNGASPRIFHTGAQGLSWSTLEEITQRSESSSLFRNLFTSEEDSPNDQTPRFLKTGPHHYLIEIPGNTFDVFSYPFTVDGGGKIDWVLVGLVSHDAFKHSYLTISSTILLGMILVVLALVLGIPLFHLQMMGSTDALRSTHLLTSVLSALLGAALLTYLSLDIVLYGQVKETLKNRMEISAQHMKDSIGEELKRILHTLQAFDESEEIINDMTTVQSTSEKFPAANDVGKRRVLLEKNMKDPCAPPGLSLSTWCYPDFIYAFWMDEEASLRINWAREGFEGVATNFSLKDREYTQRVLKQSHDLWKFPRPSNQGGGYYQFFLEPITSWNTGKHTVVASIPSQRGSAEHPWVAAMEFTFHSLMNNALLPPGIGFAVLDNGTHQVLFHSEEDRNRGEHFLVETDHNATLQDLLTAKTAGHADGSYWGESKSFYVLPLDPVPWSLVVYRDKSILRSMNLMGILIAGTLYGLWSFVLYFIVWLLLKSLSTRQKSYWLWPTPRYHRAYTHLLFVNCALFFLGILGLYIFNESRTWQLMIALCVIPIIGIVAGLIIFRQKFTKERHARGEFFRTSYALSASSMLLIFAVLPALACYSSVGHVAMRAFTQSQLLEIFTSMQNTGKFQYVKKTEICNEIKHTPSNVSHHSKQNQLIPGFYPEFFLSPALDVCTTPKKTSKHTLEIFDRVFALLSQPFLPLLKHISLGGFSETWPSHTNTKDEIGDYRDIRWNYGSRSIALISNPPIGQNTEAASPNPFSSEKISPYTVEMRANFPFTFSSETFDALHHEYIISYLLIGFIFLAWLINIPRFIANKTVFLSYSTQSRFPMEAIFLSQNWSQTNNRLILGFPGQGKTPMASHIAENYSENDQSRFLHFDLKTRPPNQWSSSLSKQLKHTQNDKVSHVCLVVDHLECQWKNPACNMEKLKFLELLLRHHTSTLQTEAALNSSSNQLSLRFPEDRTTTHDPLDLPAFSTTILSNVDPFDFPFDNTEAKLSVAEARWHSLWGSFGIVHFHANPRHKPIAQVEEQANSQKDELLNKLIAKECRWTPALDHLGMLYKRLIQHGTGIPHQQDSKSSVRQAIFQLARAYYEEIWQSLTIDEQLALYHLARDRFIHVEHSGIAPLLRKGLIRFGPNLRLLNHSFREFVCLVGERDELDQREAQKENSAWQTLKWPLGIGFGIIILCLLTTQEELRAALPAVIALLPLLLQGLPTLSTNRPTMRDVST